MQASIYIVKAFVQFRNMAGMYHELEERLTELEDQFEEQGEQVEGILEVLRRFVQTAGEERRRIGFKVSKKE